jgi:hypothetical protein
VLQLKDSVIWNFSLVCVETNSLEGFIYWHTLQVSLHGLIPTDFLFVGFSAGSLAWHNILLRFGGFLNASMCLNHGL